MVDEAEPSASSAFSKRDFFSARAQTDAHKRRIISNNKLSPFYDIYTSAFDHHVLDKSPGPYQKTEKFSAEHLTYLFHSNYYRPTVLQYPDDRNEIQLEEFFELIVKPASSPSTATKHFIRPNRVSVLIGRVGVGKSTLISNIMIKFQQQLVARKIIPIRIDVEYLAGPDASKDAFFRQLYQKLYDHLSHVDIDQALLRAIWEQHAPKFVFPTVELRPTQFAVAARQFLVSLYDATNHRVLLFLDNLDKYYYLFDRGGFSEEGDKSRLNSMEKLASIITEFQSPKGALDGAGLNVLICVRRHTMNYFDQRRHVVGRALRIDEEGSNIFRVERSDPTEVINSRIFLLRAGLESAGKNPDRVENYKALQELGSMLANFEVTQLQKSEPKRRSMIEDLSRLASHGHRGLIDHFAGYRWAFSDPVTFRRFFKTYSPAIITFMLNNRLRYSQVWSRFPNLFLVRGDFENPFESPVPPRLVQRHRHSYWLKFLLCQYISLKKARNEDVNPREVLEVFAPSNDGDGCFERHLVELSLGSLSQVDVSAVIEPIFVPSVVGQGLTIGDIVLTERGRFLLDKFALEFTYLQLVTEDYLLEIPNVVFDEFAYEKLDYDYMASKTANYGVRTAEHVNLKSRWVLLFVEILESSLNCEIRRRSTTFRNLKAKGYHLPNFDDIRRGIMSSIAAVSETLDEKKILERAQDNLSFARHKRKDLDAFFEDAYIRENV